MSVLVLQVPGGREIMDIVRGDGKIYGIVIGNCKVSVALHRTGRWRYEC
ncbi:MAG: hypothetical protein ACTSXX_04390 [Candidatus Baldrarchaeia archaeon]